MVYWYGFWLNRNPAVRIYGKISISIPKKNCLVQKECDLAIFIYTANQTDEITILYHGRQNMGDKHTRKHKRRSWFTPGFEPAGLPLLSPELLVLLPLHLPLLLDGV